MRSFILLVLAVAVVVAHPLSSQGEEETPLWVRSGKYQGDMVLLPEQERGMRTGIIDTRYRWPNATIPYILRAGDFNENQAAFVKRALEFYNERTCITVREAIPSDTSYVLVTSENSGCWSYVGYLGFISSAYRPQQLNLQDSSSGTCLSQNGTTQHEFLHALGFYHQQSACDRDNYVRILWENIQSGTEGNFEKYGCDVITDFGYGYDFDSVMHYTKNSFSINGQPTIVAIDDPNKELGQRVSLTEQDIKKVNCMYAGVGTCTCV